jgi:hypothetical protein
MTPEQAVQHQLDAYNARDLKRFVQVYSDDVQVFRPPAVEPSMSGKAQFSDFYEQNRFNLPNLRADLVNRIVAGNKVVDHERVFGVREGSFEVAVVYEVVDGLIRTVWFYPGE